MNKKKIIALIVACIVLSLFADIFLAGILSARLSNFRLFGKFQILKPQAPIVINTREEVRSNDTQDILTAVDRAKSKLSLVIFTENGSVKTAGAAINITSDGLFLSVKPVLAAAKSHSLLVLLNDGRTFPVTEIFSDPATNLTMLKTSATSVPVSDIARSADLVPGQRILFLSASVLPYGSRFAASFVQFSQYDASGQILDSDRPSQSFGAQPINNTLPGQAVVNLEAGTVGIFDGTGVISSDILKPAVDLFVNQKSNLQRPSFGFHYRIINVTEADLLGTSQGAQVVKPADNQPAVLPASSAATAGLVEGDVVTAVDNVKIESNRPLAEILQKYKPGDTLKLAIVRNKIPMNLTLVAGTLK